MCLSLTVAGLVFAWVRHPRARLLLAACDALIGIFAFRAVHAGTLPGAHILRHSPLQWLVLLVPIALAAAILWNKRAALYYSISRN